jgi:membrane protease YdiL (CAAX protease family)
LAIAPDSDAQPLQKIIPTHIGVILVISYLVVNQVWQQLVFGPFSFVVERAIYLTVVLLFLKMALKIPVQDVIGSFRLPGRKDLKFFLIMLVAAVIVAALLELAAKGIHPSIETPGSPSQQPSQQPASLVGWITALVPSLVIAPLSEEPVFRGVFLSSLIGVFAHRKWWLVLLSAAIFASVHQAVLLRLVATMILGVLLAMLFLRTRSLSGCVLLHAAWNFI